MALWFEYNVSSDMSLDHTEDPHYTMTVTHDLKLPISWHPLAGKAKGLSNLTESTRRTGPMLDEDLPPQASEENN